VASVGVEHRATGGGGNLPELKKRILFPDHTVVLDLSLDPHKQGVSSAYYSALMVRSVALSRITP
jgi:hypothetical protein